MFNLITQHSTDVFIICLFHFEVHAREPRSFPGHQPELDPLHTKYAANSCYRQDFKSHGRQNKKRYEILQSSQDTAVTQDQ